MTDRSEPPRVSVVVPAFNAGHTLGECLASIRAQSLPNVEVIVVDDASRDDTKGVVAAAAWPALRYVQHDVNGGLPVARNTGLQLARASYVAFLDADDAMLPTNLAQKVDVLEHHRDAVLVHGAAVPIDAEGRELLRPQRRTGEGIRAERLFPDILFGNPVIASSVVARRDDLCAAGGFSPDLPYCDDWDLWIRLAWLAPFVYLPRPLIRYRIHASSMQWKSFAEHDDLVATREVVTRAFAQLELERRGFVFEDVYWRNYFRKMGNKIDLLPIGELLKLFGRGVAARPSAALSRHGTRSFAKLALRAVMPRRALHALRVRRYARRLSGFSRTLGQFPQKAR